MNKLELELSEIFNLKDELSFKKKINDYSYSLTNGQYQKLSNYFENAFKLFTEIIKISNDKIYKSNNIHSNLPKKLDELSENIICRKIYGLVYYKISNCINDYFYSLIRTELSKLIEQL